MMVADDLILRLSAPHITPESQNFRLPSWPPPDDFPIVIDAEGNVVCRYGDPSWNFRLIAGRACIISFGDDPSPRGRRIDSANAGLFRQAVLWFMYGERRGISPNTLRGYATLLKSIFACCANLEKPILASDLSRFPRVVEGELAAAIAPGKRNTTLSVLHELYQARKRIGFTLLTPDDLTTLARVIPDHDKEQTPFIPPRIWLYQSSRLRTFLEDFLAHRHQIEAAFTTALDAYRHNFGSLNAASAIRNPNSSPFCTAVVGGRMRLGTFPEFAASHGVAELLARWCLKPGEAWDYSSTQHSIALLTRYFAMVGTAGTAYLLCFSGMRHAESLSLRTNCLEVEIDPRIGQIHSLRGSTTKTTQDDDARWITAPSAKIAVDAMACIARLRTVVALELPEVPLTEEDRQNPYLIQRGYEPWAPGGGADRLSTPLHVRPDGNSIIEWQRRIPNLFDPEQLRVQPEDERVALLITPSLDLSRYGVGQIWPLAPHQYRRAVAVNMSASDVVSDASQQQQLKHLVRAQTVYYGQGFAYLKFSQKFATELIATRYEMAAKESALLEGPDWVSPHGEGRKAEILLRFHPVTSGDEIERNMRKGLTAIKQTLFGICTRRDHCPYGGHDNIVHCPSCVDALLDRRKRPALEAMGRTIAVRLVDVPMGTPLRFALEGDAAAMKEAADVLS